MRRHLVLFLIIFAWDTAAFLVARDCEARRVREGGHTHAAGDARHPVHAPADSALHGFAHFVHADSRVHRP